MILKMQLYVVMQNHFLRFLLIFGVKYRAFLTVLVRVAHLCVAHDDNHYLKPVFLKEMFFSEHLRTK